MSANLLNFASQDEDDISPQLAWNKKYVDSLDKGGTRSLNLVVADYSPSWKARHGFREFYQNWDDGIKESNDLKEKTSIKKRQDDHGFVGFVALHPDSKRELGFIRLSKSTGVLEITNYKAWLSSKSIRLGSTTKRGTNYYSGQHGEGYKVATIALLRDGYPVKIKASKCDWEFFEALEGKKFEGDLCVTFKLKKDKTLKPMMERFQARKASGLPRLHQGNIWEDVTVLIGGGSGNLVTVPEFMEWTKFALELDPPSEVLTTHNGTILLDKRFSNKVFLKGILLEDASNDKPFRFGYNFAQGAVDRDRRTLSSPGEQCALLSRIWEEVMGKNKKTVEMYLDMLRTEPKPGDVLKADSYISRATATAIWRQLQGEDHDHKRFYYEARNGNEDVEVITRSLRKNPAPLTKILWDTLRKYDLIMTPHEWRHHLLSKAPSSTLEATTYSKGIQRALMSVLAMDPRTRDFELIFKNGSDADLDLLLDGNHILVNDKWLDFQGSHESGDCGLLMDAADQEISIDTFDCGHVITELYDLILVELSGLPKNQSESSLSDNSLRRQVGEKIQQTPYKIVVESGENTGEIKVSWTESESDRVWKKYGLLRKGRVALHRDSTCSEIRNQLLSPNEPPNDSNPQREDTTTSVACGCPERVVSLKDSSFVFQYLDPKEKYFAMVSTVSPQSFYGLPSTAIRPAAITQSPSQNSRPLSNLSSPETQISKSSEELTTARADLASLRDEVSRVTTKNETLKSEPKATTINSNYHKELLQTARTKLQTLEKQHANTRKELLEACKNLDQQKDTLAVTNKTLADRDEEILNLKRGNEDLQSDVKGYQHVFDNSEAQIKQLENDNESFRGTIENLEAQIKQLKDGIQGSHSTIETLEARIQELQSQNQDPQNTVNSLETQIQQLRHENRHLTERLDQAEDDLDNQVKVAGNLAARRRGGSSRIKRERENDDDKGLSEASGGAVRAVKRPRGAFVENKEENKIDLTEDN